MRPDRGQRAVFSGKTLDLRCLYPAEFMNEYPAIDQHPKEAGILGGREREGLKTTPSSMEIIAGLWTKTLKYRLLLP